MDFDSLLMIEILKAGFTWYGVGVVRVLITKWKLPYTCAEHQVKDSPHSGMSESFFFWDKIGCAKSTIFQFELAIWQSESGITLRYLTITSSSLICSLFYSQKK